MLSMWSKLEHIAWRRIGVSIGLAVGLALLASYALHRISDTPKTLTSIKAESEIVSFAVSNPELAILYGQGFRIAIWPDGSFDGACAEGAFLPGVGSMVTYQRIDKNPLRVTVEGTGDFRRETGETVSFAGELILLADVTCAPDLLSRRLPIWGPGSIGARFAMRSDGPAPVFLSGDLDVFGRTIDVPILDGGGSIYVAIEEMEIPPGSLIETDAAPIEGDKDLALNPEAAMFGFIKVPEDKPGLAVSVSTESLTLTITPPGGRANSSRVDLSLLVQLINDPVFLKLQLFFVLPFLLWPMFMDAINLAYSRQEKMDPDEPPSEPDIQAAPPENKEATA
ncbi:hypothetical protein [Hoeflea ulvae]|uniref:Dicarboxylate transport domain-containing protein n=1 Tax=Hoeflea ulvae TaxID=2983764 RepID=A0ABT3YBJ4_9HYPH|nr:hypothetical protein [Hoeflea ulvae]MCY0093249.1 hypothetical protein [Hoeflea ulvae]